MCGVRVYWALVRGASVYVLLAASVTVRAMQPDAGGFRGWVGRTSSRMGLSGSIGGIRRRLSCPVPPPPNRGSIGSGAADSPIVVIVASPNAPAHSPGDPR